jgi:T5orf172 domain
MAVYFIQAIDGGRIKVGTTRQLKARLWSLSKEVGTKLRVLAVVKGHYPEEKSIHDRFAHLRAFGEWFEPGDDLMAFIAAKGAPWDGKDDEPTIPMKVWLEYWVGFNCQFVAQCRGVPVGEYISESIKEIAERDAKIEGRLMVQRDRVTWPVDD